MNQYDIIKRPLVTEKSTLHREVYNKITFEVDPNANRVEIQKVIEHIFKVKVDTVRTVNVKGKIKRRGRILGKLKDRKKAIVTLMPGERIDFFEGV